jgi:hypothetical protein
MKLIDSFIGLFATQVHAPHAQKLFLRVAYAVMFATGCCFFTLRHDFFGPHTFIRPFYSEPSLKVSVAYLLNNTRGLAIPAYYSYLGLTLFAVFYPRWRAIRIAVFALGVMLYYACVPAFTAGWILYYLFACYLIFFTPNARHPFAVFITNLAFLSARLQLVLVYLIAGIAKVSGETWVEGSSVYYALHLNHYTEGWLRDLLAPLTWPLMLITWLWLIYHLVFPVLVWWPRARLVLFSIGICVHTFIAIGFSLPDFGLAMIRSYTLFTTKSAAYRLDVWKQKLLARIGFRKALE